MTSLDTGIVQGKHHHQIQAISISDGTILSKPLMVTHRATAPGQCYMRLHCYRLDQLYIGTGHFSCSATIMPHITSSMNSTLWWVSWLQSGDDSIKHIVQTIFLTPLIQVTHQCIQVQQDRDCMGISFYNIFLHYQLTCAMLDTS